jgi:hypothetical protein
VLGNVRSVLNCFIEYENFKISKDRLNSFFSIEEKNDNIGGLKIGKDEEVLKIEFKKVGFKY